MADNALLRRSGRTLRCNSEKPACATTTTRRKRRKDERSDEASTLGASSVRTSPTREDSGNINDEAESLLAKDRQLKEKTLKEFEKLKVEFKKLTDQKLLFGNQAKAERELKEKTVMEFEKLKVGFKKLTNEKVLFENLAEANEHRIGEEIRLKTEVQKQLEKISEEKLLLETNFNDILQEIQTKQGEAEKSIKDMVAKTLQIQDSSQDRIARRFTMFSNSELLEATNNFHPDLEIGNGSLGPFMGCRVYKGKIRSVTVTINVVEDRQVFPQFCSVNPDVTHSGMRHQHLLSPIGGCQHPKALVYEYLVNGSLEDRLLRKDGTPPLNWQTRARIVAEICSTLIFLHSFGTANCGLILTNVLLDAEISAKILSFAVRISKHELSSYQRHDTIALGKIILRLLTGNCAGDGWVLKEMVEKAVRSQNLRCLIDPSAGEWPQNTALELANLGLECCSIRDGAELKSRMRKILNSIKEASLVASASSHEVHRSPREPPSYFICPISQEIMRDPQVAADGFTYEREELLKWFQKGRKTSPMTNKELVHLMLTPNHALRSAIQEWVLTD